MADKLSRNYLPYNRRLRQLARSLRKNGTLGEVLLWRAIKGRTLGWEFHRQVPIRDYIVDFYCHELMLAIEVDGSSHELPEAAEKDIKRQNALEDLGVRFLRFREEDMLKNLHGVVAFIERWIVRETEPPIASPIPPSVTE